MRAAEMIQEASGVGHTLAIRAILDAAALYPPQVDVSEYVYLRRETRSDVVGMWRWRTLSFLAVSGLLAISPSKQAITHPFRSSATYYRKGDTASFRLFYFVTTDYADLETCIYFVISPTCISPLLFGEQISLLSHDGPADIQMYSSPLNRRERVSDRRITSRLIFAFSSSLLFEGDRKKDGKPLKPVKPIKPKIKKQKPGREGDKEKQEENDPRTEGPMLWTMQKSRACISL